MPWYLGRPGSILQLPAPSRGTQTPYERIGATHQLLSGGRVRDSFGVKRSWQFTWQALTQDQVGVLNGFVYATYGPGPYVLIDPEQRNLLTPNVSSGTDYSQDTTGFAAIAAGVTFTSSTAANAIGQRSLSVQWASGISTSASGVQSQGPYTVVRPSTAYTGQIAVGFRTGMAGFAAECRVIWYDATQTYISENVGSSLVVPTASFSVLSCSNVTSPSNAAYASVRLANNSTTTSVATVFADDWQLEAGPTVSSWVPGLGTAYVTVDVPGRSRQQTNQNDYNLTLVEV